MSDHLSAANSTSCDTPIREGSTRTELERPEPRLQLDAAASAALALAVSSARKTSPNTRGSRGAEQPRLDPAASPSREIQAKSSRTRVQSFAFAAVALVALATGGLGARALQSVGQAGSEGVWPEMTQLLRDSHASAIRLAGDVKALKADLEDLKRALDQAQADARLKHARLEERLDRSVVAVRPVPPETLATLARMGEQLDGLESRSKDPAPKFDAVIERLEHIERRIAAPMPVAVQPADLAPRAAAPDLPAPTGTSLHVQAKDTPVEGWVLHEVYGGTALIESRNRRLVEVAAGEMVPGVGRVEAIERRGKRWVVVTSKGLIGTVR